MTDIPYIDIAAGPILGICGLGFLALGNGYIGLAIASCLLGGLISGFTSQRLQGR